jgi:hypothetical protein
MTSDGMPGTRYWPSVSPPSASQPSPGSTRTGCFRNTTSPTAACRTRCARRSTRSTSGCSGSSTGSKRTSTAGPVARRAKRGRIPGSEPACRRCWCGPSRLVSSRASAASDQLDGHRRHGSNPLVRQRRVNGPILPWSQDSRPRCLTSLATRFRGPIMLRARNSKFSVAVRPSTSRYSS